MVTDSASTGTPDPERMGERRAAVTETVARVREVAARDGVNRASLEEMARALDLLAQRDELFGTREFPDPQPGMPARLYLLHEDEEGRFPLYLTCSNPGGEVPPHNHTTWALVSGLSGEEENRLWERTDGGDGPGPAALVERQRRVIRGGEHLALMPEDIHSVATPGSVPRRHFHMYGLSLERLPARLVYDTAAGTCRYMEANPKIVRVAHA